MPKFKYLESNDLSLIHLSSEMNTEACLAVKAPASGIRTLAFLVMNHQTVSPEIEAAWRMKSSVFI